MTDEEKAEAGIQLAPAKVGESLEHGVKKHHMKHEFYVYHDGPNIYARIDNRTWLTETCETPQEAHDKVQAITNPFNKIHQTHAAQKAHEAGISERCKPYCEEHCK